MEFGQGRPLTGCLMTPLVSFQNPGPEKFQEVRERALASFSALKKNKSQAWGGNGLKKNRVQELF